ncbi:MAG: HAMP domain-containing protein [Pyrinomonadaceae bacterium]|nr:HAMP domain-containing protein [Pyrinomonadaceae bacterium]
MGIRPKLFLIFFFLGIAPMLLLSVLLYWNSVRSVEALLRTDVERDATGIVREVEAGLHKREAGMVVLARSPALLNYVRDRNSARSAASSNNSRQPLATGNLAPPAEVEAEIRAFLRANPGQYNSITCLNPARRPLFRAEPPSHVGESSLEPPVKFQTEDFLSSDIAADERVWTTTEPVPLRSALSGEASGAKLRYTIPVFTGGDGMPAPRGALIVELSQDKLFEQASVGRVDEVAQSPAQASESSNSRFILMLDRTGQIVYHTSHALRYQSVKTEIIPNFADISSTMMSGESGWKFYQAENARWLVVYRPVSALGLSVAVAGNHTNAVKGVQRLGWICLILSTLFGLVTAVVLTGVVGRMARSIERVTEGAVAIAGGKLDQRIEVRSSDETHLLAESFNIMTDRVREQIARETESRQFASFMRLSAMLTHDLKNSIASLSLLVENMERQFHREEFRADAMKSLTAATNKLRALVAKLSEPVQSLSSEHQLPRPVDLVPVIRHALKTIAEPVRPLHQIETELPETLVATVEVDRFEKVFENLILNALQAMGAQSGTLTVKAGPTPHGEVFFSVTDTGPGMSEEFQRTKLFRAFATTKKTGVGLGLYTCREIIRAHGGHIDVESKRGSGTTFRVVIPSEQKITGHG